MIKDNKKKLKKLVGEVISDKMDKTVTVKVVRTFVEPSIAKVISRAKKYKVHDEQGLAKLGDIVEIYEGKPKSKTKYMYLNKVMRSSNQKIMNEG